MASKKTTSDVEKTKPSLDLFMILGNILVDKDMHVYQNHISNELFQSAFSSYMIIRYLTMNSNNMVRKVIMDNQLVLEKMADKPELMYKLLIRIVPKTYSRFTPYIKSGFPTKKIEKILS